MARDSVWLRLEVTDPFPWQNARGGTSSRVAPALPRPVHCHSAATRTRERIFPFRQKQGFADDAFPAAGPYRRLGFVARDHMAVHQFVDELIEPALLPGEAFLDPSPQAIVDPIDGCTSPGSTSLLDRVAFILELPKLPVTIMGPYSGACL